MNIYRSRIFLSILAMAILLLMAACQPSVTGTTSPVQADTQAPAPMATEITVTMVNPETVEPTEGASPTRPSGESTDSAAPPEQIPEGWQVLEDSSQGFSLAYPPEWIVCEEHRYSRIFCDVQEEPAGPGPDLRLYVSAVPQDYTNEDFEVYNFIPMDRIREYMALPVGEAMLMHPGALPEYFTYTRLDNQMVGGWTAVVIENTKVWEFPEGTKQRVAFIVTEGTTFTIGIYYDTPEQLERFEQVLDHFELIP